MGNARPIRTPDQRVRAFVSSTLAELAPEREAVRRAVERLRLTPVLFELGARPHPPRELYRAYLAQSHVFIGIYWQRYGWIAPGEAISGLEDEYRLAGDRPRLLYVKSPAPSRDARLAALIEEFKSDDRAAYKRFESLDELATLVENDLALLLSERFEELPLPTDGGSDTSAPLPPTRTFGREAEIARVAALLRASDRLVTLTGPGGIGKTRIAIEVSHAASQEFSGGVHFIPLAAVRDPALVVRTIADRMGARAEGSRTAAAALADRLRGRPTLLVLDNVEQVTEAAPALAQLLESCGELRILATSRHALRIRAEREVAVAPLPLPDPAAPAEELAAHPAVSLFLSRAASSGGRGALAPGDASSVAELCRRLDGLPLAIELAAAQSRVLSPATLVARLERGLELRGGGDLPERQRTLRATLDWSHALLEDRERALFARLAVFAGGFTLEAAEAICAAPDDSDLLGTLSALLDKSLVSVADRTSGEPRFHLLETIRSYAAERLQARGETALMRERHAAFFAAFARAAQPFLCGPGQRDWLTRVDPERANLRLAVEAALARGDGATVVAMSWDAYVYYWVRDGVEDPEEWLERVVASGCSLAPVTRARLETLRALTRASRGDYGGNREALVSALATFRAHELPFEAAVALKELGFVRFLVDRDASGAIHDLEEASSLFESLAHDWGIALAETMLGTVHAATGDSRLSELHLARALERAAAIGNEPLVAQSLQQLAVLRIRSGQHDEALELLTRAGGIFRTGRFEGHATYCLDALAAVALARGSFEVAARALFVAQAVRSRLGIAAWPTLRGFVEDVTRALRSRVAPEELERARLDAAPWQATAALEPVLEALAARRP